MTDQITGLVVKPVNAVRRNHALEHATLHILSRKYKDRGLGGYSDPRGFWIVGDIDTEDIQMAVDEGLQRLRNGESDLAIHPNCGTNYALPGMVAGSLAWLGMVNNPGSFKKKVDRLPLIITLVTMALILVQPLGPVFQQRVTTNANPGSLSIYEITRFLRHGINMHRVTTHS